MRELKYVEAHDLWNYTLQVTQAVLEGYRPSDVNEYYPVQLGIGYYCATLVRDEEELEPEHVAVVYPDPVPVVGAGEVIPPKQRKPKNQPVAH